MRVLFVHNGLGAGGAERSLAELLPRLASAGIESTVVCLYRRAEGVEQAVLRAGHDVRFLSAKRTPSRVRELRDIIRTEKPDLVHTTFFESNIVGRIASVGRHVAVISSLVNTPYSPERLRENPGIRPYRLRLAQEADAWTARHLTTHLHAVSRSVKDWAVATLRIPAERVTVIERGRDTARLGRPDAARRTASRAALGLREDEEVVLTVGRQENQKGHMYLLQAMDDLAGRRSNVVLLIAGREGDATNKLKEILAASTHPGAIRFLGHREDVPELMAAADVFTFPSLYEGGAGAVVEAMALGLPLVLNDIPALREVSEPGRSAVLVEPAAPAALASALGSLLDDPDLRRSMGRRNREIFEERFTLDRSAGRMIELYERLISGSTARRSEEVPIG